MHSTMNESYFFSPFPLDHDPLLQASEPSCSGLLAQAPQPYMVETCTEPDLFGCYEYSSTTNTSWYNPAWETQHLPPPSSPSTTSHFPYHQADSLVTSPASSCATPAYDEHRPKLIPVRSLLSVSAMCHCGKSFRRQSDLMYYHRHMAERPLANDHVTRKHQKYHSKFFSCLYPGCDRVCATQKDLSRHHRVHRKGEGWRCTVNGCKKAAAGHVYGRKDNFERHLRTAHGHVTQDT